MSNTSQAIDFQKYIFDKDVDARIKTSRDDTLKIIQADIKELHADIKALDAKVEADIANVKADIKALDAKVEADIANVKADIKVLDAKIETGFKALDISIKQGKTLNKWIFGMLVTLLLGLGGLAVPLIISLIN